jgi:hypothetical protein
MYYSTLGTGKTPSPFAEFRIIVFTREPDRYSKNQLLGKLSYFIAETSVKSNKNMTAEIEGFESEQIDRDELPPGALLDRYRYYVGFHKKGGGVYEHTRDD